MNSITLLVLVVVLMSWFLFCTPLRAASIHYDYITDPSLVNKGVSSDGIWGGGDDLDIADNSLGAASYNWVGTSADYLTGFWERMPGKTSFIEEATAFPELSPFNWELNKTEMRNIHFNDVHHYETEFTMIRDLTDIVWQGSGYAIYNTPGYDDPSIFGDVIAGQVQANLTLMKTILPSSWTGINAEYFRYTETWPAEGVMVLSWTDDPENLATVPIPGALWLLGSGLVGLGVFRRKFKT